jgi:uncharacterized protein YndB with AHSA1/START domain
MTQSRVSRSIEIRAAPSKVWRQIASQEALRRWISSNLEIDLQVGGKYRFLGPDNKTWVSGHVMEFVPEGWLILSWLEEDQGWTHPGRFVIALEASVAGTKVTIIHDGFAGTGVAAWPELVADYERGSDAHGILDKLAALVNADENRRAG